MAKKIEYSLDAVNQRLTEARVKVKVYQRGDRLWVQGTFPPKPGSDRPRPYQQKISLGVPASSEGFKRAEQEARLIGAELVAGRFDWAKYLPAKPEKSGPKKKAKDWIQELGQHYQEVGEVAQSTWKNQYLKIYSRIDPTAELTAELLQAIALKTGQNTRDRLETCRKLQKLADLAGIEIDLLQYKGNYGPSKVGEKDIPSDEEVAAWRDKIPNPQWQWIYGIMATFGLRDHEAFFCQWGKEGLQVLKGKTGPRLVFAPLYPEWVEQWELKKIQIPKIRDLDRLYEEIKLGDKVARQFRRYEVPFTPYSLRHAYAIRASVTFELPITTAAALMGHAPGIHLSRYHRHISQKVNQAAVNRALARTDRPLPPI